MPDNNSSNEEFSGKEPASQDVSNDGNGAKDYSVGVLSVISLVVISILLLFGTGVGNLLNVRRLHAQLETQQAAQRYSVNDVLKSVWDSDVAAPGRAYDPARVDDVCQVMAISSGDLDSAVSLKKKFRCEVSAAEKSAIDVYFVSTTAGYSGEIALILGLEQGEILRYVGVLNHHETAGFGEVLLHSKNTWMKSLLNKQRRFFANPPTAVELDAISGATITANAVREMILQSFLTEQNTSESDE